MQSYSIKLQWMDEGYHDASSNLCCIPDFLKEASVFFNSRNSERRILCTNSDDEIIEWDCSLGNVALDITCIYHVNCVYQKCVPVIVRVLLTGSTEVQSASKNWTAAFL